MNTRITIVIITAVAAFASSGAFAQDVEGQSEGQLDPAAVVSGTSNASASSDTPETAHEGALDEIDRAEVTATAVESFRNLEVQTNPDSGTVSVKGPSSFTVFVGVTEVGRAPVDIPLMKGTWVISAVADGFKLWSTRVKVKPGKTTTLKIKEKKESGREPCRELWNSLYDQQINAANSEKHGFGMGHSINPVQAELMGIDLAVDELGSNRYEHFCSSKDSAAVAADICFPGPLARAVVKASIKGQWGSDDAVCRAVLVEDNGGVPANKVTASAGGDVLAFDGADLVCSARANALILAMFKRWGLGEGVQLRRMTQWYSSERVAKDSKTGDDKTAEHVTEFMRASIMDFDNGSVFGQVSLNIKSTQNWYLRSRGEAGRLSTEQDWESAVMITVQSGDRAVAVRAYRGNLVDIVIKSSPEAGVCAGVDTLVSMLKEGGAVVEIKNLPDSPFGVPMSEVTIETP